MTADEIRAMNAAHVYGRAIHVYGHDDSERLADQITATKGALDEQRERLRHLQIIANAAAQIMGVQVCAPHTEEEAIDLASKLHLAVSQRADCYGKQAADVARIQAECERDEALKRVRDLSSIVENLRLEGASLRAECARLTTKLERDEELFARLVKP